MTPAIPHTLTPAQYGDLAEISPELEWLANITNRKTREAYRIDVREFSAFAGLRGHAEFRTVARAHVIAWRARVAVTCDSACITYYLALRQRGHSYARPLRSVSDRLLRILIAMLKSDSLFDSTHLRHSADAAVNEEAPCAS